MNTYTAYHRAPVQGAPEAVTTYVSPLPADWATIERAVREHVAAPVRDIRHHVLRYPEMPTDPVVALRELAETYRDCARCHLSESRTFVVHFRGDPYSAVLCLGEGPGRTEDGRGIPFCGASGRYQDELMREAGVDPDKLGWGNLQGCRPCENRYGQDREPTLLEKIACSERFIMLLRAIRPRVVLLLGKEAASAFFEEPPPVNAWRTLVHPEHPQDWVAFAHLRHPAYMLRNGAAVNVYKEFKGQQLFLESLAAWMPSLEKVSRWPFGVRYLENPQPLAGKPEPKS